MLCALFCSFRFLDYVLMEKTTRQQLAELLLLLLVRLVLLPLFLLLLLLADDDFAACQQLLLREAQKTSKKLRMVRGTTYSLRRYPGQIKNVFNNMLLY